MKKEHVVFQLIKAMEATEKAYFKKYSFKKQNTSNQDFIKLFDLLDKQKDYDYDKIVGNNKINSSFRKKLSLNLNQLNNRLMSSLVDYRKGKSDLSIFANSMAEYQLLKNKGLYEIAEKRIKKLEQFVEEKDLYYFKPYLFDILNRGLINNLKINTEYKNSLNLKFEKSIEVFNNKAQLNILSTKFENLVLKNKSLIFENEDLINELKIIKKHKEDLLNKLENDFASSSVLNNNLMLINMMLGNAYQLEIKGNEFIEYFYKHSASQKEHYKSKAYDFFKNITYYSLALDNKTLYLKIYKIFETELKNTQNQDVKEKIQDYLYSIKALFHFLIPDAPLSNKELDELLNIVKTINKSKANFMELLTSISIILAREKRYQDSIDLTNLVFSTNFNNRIHDSLITLRILRLINWLKLEELDLFSSEIISLYKYLLKSTTTPFIKEYIGFIKKFSKLTNKEVKEKLLNKLLSNIENIKNNKSLFEQMEANELNKILKIAL